MKHFLRFIFLMILLSTCKSFLERKVMLLTLPIEEKNDSTLILKAHLIDYNPKKPIKEFGFAIAREDSTQLHTLSKKICTQHPDSVHLEFLIREYLDTSLLFKNPTPATISPKKVFVKSYVIHENDEITWGNLQKIELNWGVFQNITATSTSITFEYVIDLRGDCLTASISNLGLEYGFYYHTQPNPSESNHLGKVTRYLDDALMLSCLFGNSEYTEIITINNLQPRTTYYICYYVKVGNQIRYGQVFSVTTK
ncbi:MAG: hypothetical protein RMJ97_02640 [Raineya sp.]|nr:hypothetical protein [Raineya sp.]